MKSVDWSIPFSNHCNRDGAERLAQRIQRSWRDKGYAEADVWAEASSTDDRAVWNVRSNLVGGVPPGGRL